MSDRPELLQEHALKWENLAGTMWLFRRLDGNVECNDFLLRYDGTIGGYDHPNERSWRVSQSGHLEILSASGEISTRFDRLLMQDETLTLMGRFLLDQSRQIVLVLERKDWRDGLPVWAPQSKLIFHDQIKVLNWTIGDHSYGRPLIYSNGPEKLHIGKYSSIGESVTIVLAGHRPDFVSTYPFALYRDYWRSVPPGVTDHRGKGDVRIGSDVWIGHGAFYRRALTLDTAQSWAGWLLSHATCHLTRSSPATQQRLFVTDLTRS